MLRRSARLGFLLALLAAPLGPSLAQTPPDEETEEMDEADQPQTLQGPAGDERRRGNERSSGNDRAAGNDRSASREIARRKAASCRNEARRQNLRGREVADFTVICVAEARLACLKRAVQEQVRGAQRRDYIDGCLDRS